MGVARGAGEGPGGGSGHGSCGTPGGLVEAPAPGHAQVEREARYRLHGGKDTRPRLFTEPLVALGHARGRRGGLRDL